MRRSRFIPLLCLTVLATRAAPRSLAGPSPIAPPGFRITHYRLELHVDTAARALAGRVRATGVTTTAAVTELPFDLASALVVDSVRLDRRAAPFSRARDLLTVLLPRPRRRGAAFVVTVSYHGHPTGRGFSFSRHDGVPMISSYGLPYTAREWWPCRDAPAAKADSADILVTVPEPLVAASNGRLARVTREHDHSRTFAWQVRYPISPDAISLAVTDFVTLESSYHPARGGAMPLVFYVYPQDRERARRDFALVPELLRTYAAWFGEYPFLKEKYGIAEFATPSYREHHYLGLAGSASLAPRRKTAAVRSRASLFQVTPRRSDASSRLVGAQRADPTTG